MTEAGEGTRSPDPPSLFEACATCGETDPDRCRYEVERILGLAGLRPRDCIAAWNPATAEIPF